MRNKKIIIPLTIILLLLAALLSIIISGYTAINRAENQFAEKNYADAAEFINWLHSDFPGVKICGKRQVSPSLPVVTFHRQSFIWKNYPRHPPKV